MCRSFLSAISSGETAGRNNLGVVTLNLPRIGLMADGDLDKYNELLLKYTSIGLDALNWRIDRLRKVKAKMAPILYMEGAFGCRLQAEDYVFDHFIGRSSASLGYIGCHELAKAMFGDVDVQQPHITKFLLDTLEFLESVIQEEKELTGIGFSLYATPSESLCDRFCRIDAKLFPNRQDVVGKGYYTNSHHMDVYKKVSPDTKWDYEMPFTKIAKGGCISYIEVPNMKNFIKALEYVIDYAAARIHYFGINSPVDTCMECDFAGESVATEDGFSCPCCGNTNPETLQVTRRVCGYLGSPNSRPFNPGKQLEVMGRVKHADVRARNN